jgi:phosphate:Na+ symporter
MAGNSRLPHHRRLEAAAVPGALSLFHTLFNVIKTVLMVGFIPQIARFVSGLVPAIPEPALEIDQPVYLDRTSSEHP